MKQTYIYALIDPRTDTVRYIGKSVDPYSRYFNHIHVSTKANERTHKANWIRQLDNLGLSPKMETLEVCDGDDWIEAERWWIKLYRETTPNLTNITDGGDKSPMSGRKHSEEAKLLIAKAMRERYIASGKVKVEKEVKIKLSDGELPEGMLKGFKDDSHRKAFLEAGRNANKRFYVVTRPDGSEEVIDNLVDFCKSNSLSEGCMRQVVIGNNKQHKKYKIRHANDTEVEAFKLAA